VNDGQPSWEKPPSYWSKCVYGTNQASWRFCKWDFLQVCTELRALTNYCSRSAPLWQNYDSAWGMRMDGLVWGRRGSALGWTGISRETTNTSFIFLPVYMWLQLDSEVKCELRFMHMPNFYQSYTRLWTQKFKLRRLWQVNLLLLRCHYSPTRTFPSLTDFSQSALFLDRFSQFVILNLLIYLHIVPPSVVWSSSLSTSSRIIVKYMTCFSFLLSILLTWPIQFSRFILRN